MVIVDTSVWVSHFRQGSKELEKLLMDGEVLCHPFIIGEIACGYLTNRREILSLFQNLPMARIADEEELLTFIEQRKLYGLGVGFIDVHLLASALLSGVKLWTEDKKLQKAAYSLRISFQP